MPALTLKNIPENLYLLLKESAKAHHRSLNGEILHCVEHTLSSRKVDTEQYIDSARSLRQKSIQHPINSDSINKAIDEGRP